jgi:hypothetical protein
MSDALVLSDSIAGSADALPPALACWWTDDGLDAAWVHVAGELDVATVPQLDRTLREPQVQARLGDKPCSFGRKGANRRDPASVERCKR